MSTSYIGADVDCKMTELAVERAGLIISRKCVPTDIKSIRGFLSGIAGRRVMTVEEGPMAGWLYRSLRSEVDRFVVCDPRRNRLVTFDGDKDNRIDAEKLARLLRGGYLREVHHTEDEERAALKEAVALYHDRVKDLVRQINKLRGYCRQHGIRVPGRVVRNPTARQEWLREIHVPALCKQLSVRWIGLDATVQQVKMAKQEMAHLAGRHRIIGFWRDLPGVGLIRAATLFAYLDTPWRFHSPKALWKYCGVGLKRFASGSDNEGRPKPGRVRLFRAVNRLLKDAIMGAALNAIWQGDNPFADHYWRMIRQNVTPSNARHTAARKLLAVMVGMWKTGSRYDQELV